MSAQLLHTFVNSSETTALSPLDRGLAFGDGVFETLVLCEGKLQNIAWHLDRLTAGLDRLQIALARLELESQLNHCIAELSSQQIREGLVKIIVTRGEGRGYAPAANACASVIQLIFAPPDDSLNKQRDGVSMTICRQRLSYQPTLIGIKHLNRLDNVLAALEMRNNDFDEGLLLDDQGHVVEAISRNIFAVKEGILVTPNLQRGGVAGVVRRIICEQLAPALPITVHEATVTIDWLAGADEIFLCNSVSGIWPVSRFEDKQLAIGSITQRLQIALKKKMKTY